jgi:hypothetical protein
MFTNIWNFLLSIVEYLSNKNVIKTPLIKLYENDDELELQQFINNDINPTTYEFVFIND